MTNTPKPILKPCPFCGGDDLSLTHDSHDAVCWVYCNGCYSTGRAGHTEDQTASHWNTRPQPTEAQIEAAARVICLYYHNNQNYDYAKKNAARYTSVTAGWEKFELQAKAALQAAGDV